MMPRRLISSLVLSFLLCDEGDVLGKGRGEDQQLGVAVDITAASTAARTNPPKRGWKRALVMARRRARCYRPRPQGGDSIHPYADESDDCGHGQGDDHPDGADAAGAGNGLHVLDADETGQDVGLTK